MVKEKKGIPINRLKEIISIMKKHHLIRQMNPVHLKEALEELGPTFIKLGQIMADREDLLEPSYCNELRKLRSEVKPMDEETIKNILKRELGEKRFDFTHIEATPVGSASIAQVHRAKVHGHEVALKIKRENIDYQMEMDIQLLKRIVKIFPLKKIFHNSVDFNTILDEMLDSAKNEMNFLQEANFMEEFREKNATIPYIRVPYVYHQYTTSQLLVMEYINAPKINEISMLTAQDYDMEQVALLLAKNYLKQVLEDGFYHADPHPDNIKLANSQIIYLDFGMMGRLTEQNKNILKQCVQAILWQDYEKLAKYVILLGKAENINQQSLEQDLALLLEKNQNIQIGHIDLKDFAPSFLSIIQKYHIDIPKDVILLFRGILVLEGVLEDIHPNISLMDALRTQNQLNHLLTKENIEKTFLSLIQNGKALCDLPREFLAFTKAMRKGDISFSMETSSSKKELQRKKEKWLTLLLTLLDCALIIAIALSTISRNQETRFFTILFTNFFLLTTLCLMVQIIVIFHKKD